MKTPKSSLFSFGKKAQPTTPPAAAAPAAPVPAKASAPPVTSSSPTVDDMLVVQLAVMCSKDAVPQERFDNLLHRARLYVSAKKN